VADTNIQQAAMVNSLENFKYVFDKALEGKVIDRMDQNQEIFARYMNDPAFAKVVAEFLRKQVYESTSRLGLRRAGTLYNNCKRQRTSECPPHM
jgi:type I restriction enzyme R subunit